MLHIGNSASAKLAVRDEIASSPSTLRWFTRIKVSAALRSNLLVNEWQKPKTLDVKVDDTDILSLGISTVDLSQGYGFGTSVVQNAKLCVSPTSSLTIRTGSPSPHAEAIRQIAKAYSTVEEKVSTSKAWWSHKIDRVKDTPDGQDRYLRK